MSSEVVLSFADVSKTYPPNRTPLRQLWSQLVGQKQSGVGFTALQSLSFEVRRGESLGVVGMNGAGKSTLLQLAAGTLTPSHGQVQSRGRIAALLELGSGFNPEATGRENIYLYAATMGLSREQTEARLDSIVDFSGLRDALDMPVKTYSSGMQVRLAFSVATSVEPDILIVDEALSVGDGVFAKRSFDRVMQLRERGTALLLCSHTLFHVDLFCERSLWLDRGKIEAFGPTSVVVPRYQEYLDNQNQPGGGPPVVPASQQVAGQGTPLSVAQTGAEPAPADEPQVEPTRVALPGEDVMENLAGANSPELVKLVRAQVALDGVVGKELKGRSLESRLTVDVHLQVSQEEPHPRAAVVISSDTGKIIGSTFSGAGAIQAQDVKGHAHIRFELPDLPLNKGRYRVGVYLLSHDGRYVYEWVDPFAHIELTSSSVHQGPWLIPGTWHAAGMENTSESDRLTL